MKLDWTLTGLQTFGGETLKDEKLMVNTNDFIIEEKEQQKENIRKSVEESGENNLKTSIDDLFAKTSDNYVEGQNYEEDEDDYESINPTTTPIGKSCIDELILDLTNNSFDLNNHNNEIEKNKNILIDTFLTSSLSVNETIEQQKYDESSISSTTSSITQQTAVASPIQQQQLKVIALKSSIDDLLSLRPKSKPPTIVPVKTASLAVMTNQPKPAISLSAPNVTSITSIELKSPKKQTMPLKIPSTNIINKTKTVPNTVTQVKSRPQITQVVKNDQTTSNCTQNKPLIAQIAAVNNNNKKCVIYKIESKDLNNKLKGTNSQEEISYQTSVKQEKRINPLLTDHNTSLLTKMKTSKSNQNIYNEDQQSEIGSTSATSLKIPNAPSNLTVSNTKISNQNNNKSTDTKIYTINDSLLNDVAKSVNVFDNYENYLKIAQKYSPIINKNANKVHLPFCARSLNEYFAWPHAKRRANEWIRALNVKKRANSMIMKAVC